MRRTFWNRIFSVKSTRPSRHDRLRRYQPLFEKMEERALLAAVAGSAGDRKLPDPPALVGGMAGDKSAAPAIKADTVRDAGAKGGLVSDATVSESKLSANARTDAKGATTSSGGAANPAAAKTDSKSGEPAPLPEAIAAKNKTKETAQDSSVAGNKSDVNKSSVKESQAKSGRKAESAARDTKASTTLTSTAKGMADRDAKGRDLTPADKLPTVGGTLLNQLTAEANDAALLEVIAALQLPAVQAAR